MVLAFLCSAYDEEELEGGDVRTVLRFHPALAPVKIGVLPRRNLIPERFPNLRDAERDLLPGCTLHVLKIYKNPLRRLRSEIRPDGFRPDPAPECIETGYELF